MNTSTIITAFLVPICVAVFYIFLNMSNSKISEKMSDDRFVVSLPKPIMYLGIILDVVILIPVIGITVTSSETPHIIFYVVMGLFIWLGTFLILKTSRFRVFVSGEDITVYSIFRAPYSFMFKDIVSVKRQVKKNEQKSERITIKTKTGRKLIVETPEISYQRFVRKIELSVDQDLLTGFDQISDNKSKKEIE